MQAHEYLFWKKINIKSYGPTNMSPFLATNKPVVTL